MFNKILKNSMIKLPQQNYRSKTPFYIKSINQFFDDAAQYTNISPDIIKYIKTPDATLKINIPLLRDDGTYTTVVAYRCHHKKHKLPIKGGIIIQPRMSLESIEITAMLKTMQLGLLDIPFGGGKGGIKINPDLYSKREIERIMRRFTVEMKKYKFIGPQVDVPAPEAGANQWHMDLIRDTYQTLYGMNDINTFAVVTGKTANMGGILESDKSRGGGVYYSMKHLLMDDEFETCRQKYNLEKGLDQKEVIINGFGVMGQQVATYLYNRNVKITGIQEKDGVVFNRNGINIDEFIEHMDKYQTVYGFVDHIEDEDVYNRECDFLVVASPSGTITLENVEEVKCKVLIEAANGAISYKADKYLNQNNILIIPDIIANGGNLISSYMEWLKNIQHKSISKLKTKWQEKSKRMLLKSLQKRLNENGINCDFEKILAEDLRGGTTKDYVETTIESIIGESLKKTWKKAEKENCSLRLGGLSLSMININDALKNTGLL